MSEALGTGWLITLIVAIPTFLTVTASVLVPFGRWVARRNQAPASELEADKEMLTAALEDKSTQLVEVLKEKSVLEIKLDSCIGEVRYWRAGKEPPAEARFRPLSQRS